MSDLVSDDAKVLTDAEILERFRTSKNQPPCSLTTGFSMLSVSQEKKEVQVAFNARADLFANPMGQVQGGYLCAMLDDAMSIACLVTSGMTCAAPTLEMKTSFMRPAMPGILRAVGRVAKWGKTIAFTEGELYDADGRLLAKATGTAMPTPFSNFKRPKA